MPQRNPILITGAAGEIGGVSRTMVEMLLDQEHPLRAFVRRDDERAHALRQAGAEVFVGDLLNIADVTAAWKGCRRVYFSMSLSPYYTDAVTLMAAAVLTAGPVLAGACTNADKPPAAGVQVTISFVTGHIIVSSGLQQRIDAGVVDPITFEGFQGLAGFDITGDDVADVTTFIVGPNFELPEEAQLNGAACHGIVNIEIFFTECLT